MSDKARQILKQLVDQHGRELVNQPDRVKGLLLDLCAGQMRETNLLVAVVKQGMAGELFRDGGRNLSILVPRMAKQLHQDYGFDPKFARWAVETWVTALGFDAGKVEKPPGGAEEVQQQKNIDPPPSVASKNTSGRQTPKQTITPPPVQPPSTWQKPKSSSNSGYWLLALAFVGLLVLGGVYMTYKDNSSSRPQQSMPRSTVCYDCDSLIVTIFKGVAAAFVVGISIPFLILTALFDLIIYLIFKGNFSISAMLLYMDLKILTWYWSNATWYAKLISLMINIPVFIAGIFSFGK
jgi:hypothetical protein